MSRQARRRVANGKWKNRDLAETPAHSPDPRRPTLNRNDQCEIFSFQPPPSSWPEQHLPPPLNRLSRPTGPLTTSCSSMALSSTRRAGSPLPISSSKKGYNVTLVENPLTSLAADVDATKQALAKQNGKTVLVGHSWGGVVITEAGNDPKVSALVYVSAFAPDVGQSLATLASSGPATEGAAAIHPDDKGNLYIDPKVFPSAVAADLPPQDRRVPGALPASVKPHSVRGSRRHGGLARQTDVLCDQHEGQGHRTRGPEDIRSQDACPDDGGRWQPCLPRRPCEGSRRGH